LRLSGPYSITHPFFSPPNARNSLSCCVVSCPLPPRWPVNERPRIVAADLALIAASLLSWRIHADAVCRWRSLRFDIEIAILRRYSADFHLAAIE